MSNDNLEQNQKSNTCLRHRLQLLSILLNVYLQVRGLLIDRMAVKVDRILEEQGG